MKIFSTLLLFIFSTLAFGQVDSSNLKISKRVYYKYSFKERECYTDNDSLISESDSLVKDSVISEIEEMSYPIVKTLNKKLEKFLNDSIHNFFEVNELNTTSSEFSWSLTCMDDKPDEFSRNFKINFINSRYLSLTMLLDWEAGGGANGASHQQKAISFDLKKRKILFVKDIIEEKYDSLIYKEIISQIKASYDKWISDNFLRWMWSYPLNS